MYLSSKVRPLLILCLLLTVRLPAQDVPAATKRQPGQVPEQVSPEGVAYLERLMKNTPFGSNQFDFEGLRKGMGSRRAITVEGVQTRAVKVGEIPAEWVLAPGTDTSVRLLYLHGGGFVSGSGGFYLPLAAHISAAAKCAVLLVDYRLAPEHRFPAGLDDCVLAHDWLRSHGPDGAATARATFVAGDSAGGNLTLATLLALRERRLPLPQGAIAISPAADLTLASKSLQTVFDPIISAKTMPIFRDHYLGGQDPANPLASPVFGDYRGLPPLLIQAGEHEMLRDDSVRAAQKARSDGIDVKLEIWRGMFHVFQSHDPLLPEGKEAVDHIAQFIQVLTPAIAQESPQPKWSYRPELLRPFWEGDTVEGESLLFIRDDSTGEARASVLFPIREVLTVCNSAGDVKYENGKDFVWKPDAREIVLPAGSRIPSRTPQELRRPAKTQKYELTHRDGNGEIFFGARLEYAEIQTCVTYRHSPDLWKSPVPKFDSRMLPRSVARLVNRQPLTMVVLGDSISAGANASALFDAAPYQPAYPELVRRQLAERFRNQIEMKNLAVGGTDTGWGLTQMDKVIEAKPNLVILAFGMNDSANRSPQSYQENTRKMIAAIHEKLPECEFILVASMLGNRDWVRLKPEAFPQYRDALAELVEPNVALADLTSIWTGFLELKKDWDQSGNGVNHPNDFGHRVYAQVITALLDPRSEPNAVIEPPKRIFAGTFKLITDRTEVW